MSISDDQMIVDKLGSMPDWDGVPALFHFRLMSAHVTRKDSGKGPFLPAESYLLPPSNKDGADFIVPAATNFYDNGVREADRFVETIVNLLRRKGYLNRALIVVTADHGEALGEHGMYAHANSVREEVLRVPVMFIAQGYEPERLQAASAFPPADRCRADHSRRARTPSPRHMEGAAAAGAARADRQLFRRAGFLGPDRHAAAGQDLEILARSDLGR